MLRVNVEKNAEKFLARCGEFLHKFEAEHTLLLSMSEEAVKNPKDDIKFYILSYNDEFVMAAAQVPGHNLILSRAAQDGVETLAEVLASENISFPGVVGPADVAAAFTNSWAAATGHRFGNYMDQIIYALKKVTSPPATEGTFRMAASADEKIVATGIVAFCEDGNLPKSERLTPAEGAARAKKRIAANRIAIWEVKGKPVAQAGVSGTDTVSRISLVYTPPEQRGKGYASAVVAALSQKQLDEGKKMCCLYADARNPVSNSIYRKIGFEFVGRSSLYVLNPEEPASE